VIPGGASANELLVKLPKAERDRIGPLLRRVPFRQETVYEADAPMGWVYFPVRGMLAEVAELAAGRAVEVGTIGREGMAGVTVFLGTRAAPHRVISAIPGESYALSATAFVKESERSRTFTSLLQLYSATYMAMLAQTAACTAAHAVGLRLSRWLLLCQDRRRGRLRSDPTLPCRNARRAKTQRQPRGGATAAIRHDHVPARLAPRARSPGTGSVGM
jgi:CRP-like cAMP-binding protein